MSARRHAHLRALARRRERRRLPSLRGRGAGGDRRPRRGARDPAHAGEGPRGPLELQGGEVRLVRRRGERQAEADVQDEAWPTCPPTGRSRSAPLRAFPIIRDLVTDVSWNYEVNKQIPPFSPRKDATWLMAQEDVERVKEFRKCIECFLCQDVCHILRDHDLKSRYFGPRFLVRIASLEMHPLDDADRTPAARGSRRPRALQHHQVLHRGLPGGDPHHRQRDHPAEGARRSTAATTRCSRWSGSSAGTRPDPTDAGPTPNLAAQRCPTERCPAVATQICQSPSRRTGTRSPAVVMPVTSSSFEPIMKSMWIPLWLRRSRSSSPAEAA